ncbi:MAG: Fic family protein [Acidobacteria bacterium]|nr:Fic family protein [Acidobacteriota bacterium]MBI3427088.1 Fic family protein [Acidobacteriota bacterium]
MTLAKLLKEIDLLQARLQRARPLQPGEVAQLRDYFRVGLTYTSNALEGNSLTEIETKVVIEDGLTVSGKPLREHLEAVGHAAAYDRMRDLAHGVEIGEADVRELHRLFYRQLDESQAGVYRQQQVWISGSEFKLPTPRQVPKLMHRLFERAPKQRARRHPVVFAAWLHLQLVTIHPFIDGNGRTARLALNLSLLQDDYPLALIPPLRRVEYLQVLEREHMKRVSADRSDSFEYFIADCLLNSMHDYRRLLDL